MDIYEIGSLPIGFSMTLAQDLRAMENFVKLNHSEKETIISYIQQSTTGEEAEYRVRKAVHDLHYDLY